LKDKNKKTLKIKLSNNFYYTNQITMCTSVTLLYSDDYWNYISIGFLAGFSSTSLISFM